MKFLVFLSLLGSLAQAQLLAVDDVLLTKTSVKVINLDMNSGGSGSVLSSSDKGSIILTNKHVCGVIEKGGLIEKDGKVHLITHYKKYDKHDLCLIRIKANLNVSLKVAESSPVLPEESMVVGHPSLLPTIITKGHFSDRIVIQIVVGSRPCTATDDPLICFFFGAFPIIEQFDSQVTTNLIQPGSSGSPVFNSSGELSGVVFAGAEGLSYAFIVPLEYVINFLETRKDMPWSKVGQESKKEKKTENAKVDLNKCKNLPTSTEETIKNFCKTIKDTLIY